MKRLTMIAALILLAGCTQRTGNALSDRMNDPHVLIDHGTGCEYLAPPGSSGMVPRIAADGKTHMGCKAVQP